MIRRCKRNKLYAQVSVCERWKICENFIEDILFTIGERPTINHSLDRIDGTKGYERGNVRWATKRQQSANMKNNFRVNVGGVTLNLKEWERKLGVCTSTFHNYAKKRGVSKEEAVREYCKRKNFPLAKLSENNPA